MYTYIMITIFKINRFSQYLSKIFFIYKNKIYICIVINSSINNFVKQQTFWQNQFVFIFLTIEIIIGLFIENVHRR